MIKRLLIFIVAASVAAAIAGCSNSDEPDVKIPVSKPGEGKFQPSGVQSPGGAQGGATQTPTTE